MPWQCPDPALLAQLHRAMGEVLALANALSAQDYTTRTGQTHMHEDNQGHTYLLAADEILHGHRYVHAMVEGGCAPCTWNPQEVDRMKARTRAELPPGMRPYYPLDCEGGRNAPSPVHWPPEAKGPAPSDIQTRVKELFANGMSRKAIAKRLNAEGIKGPRGGSWQTTSVCRLLRD